MNCDYEKGEIVGSPVLMDLKMLESYSCRYGTELFWEQMWVKFTT